MSTDGISITVLHVSVYLESKKAFWCRRWNLIWHGMIGTDTNGREAALASLSPANSSVAMAVWHDVLQKNSDANAVLSSENE